MSIIFGPIKSRRFGESLGVDLSPTTKQCNYDCLYCELNGKRAIDTMTEVLSVESILNEIELALKKFSNIDSITITANGEPTMYPYLYELMLRLEDIKEDKKTLLLSNGSLLHDVSVARACMLFDRVKFSLDAITHNVFKKIDRPHKNISLDKILAGLYEFWRDYSGELYAEILFVKSINDSVDEVEKMAKFLSPMNLMRLDIGTIDRPPAYKVEPISFERLEEFSRIFSEYGINVLIPKRSKTSEKLNFSLSKDEIIKLLSLRPLSEDEVSIRFSKDSMKNLEELRNQGLVKLHENGGIMFYEVWCICYNAKFY